MQKQCHSQSTNNNENCMSKWKRNNLVQYLKDSNAPKSGNKEDLIKRCMLWKNLMLMGRSDSLNMNIRELQIKAGTMRMQLHSQNTVKL